MTSPPAWHFHVLYHSPASSAADVTRSLSLYVARSAEKERERRIAQAHSQAQSQRLKEQSKPVKKKKKDKKKDSQAMMEQIDNNKVSSEA